MVLSLTPTNLIAIIVDHDCSGFEVIDNSLMYYFTSLDKDDELQFVRDKLISNDTKIIGIVDNNYNFDFNCEEFVEKYTDYETEIEQLLDGMYYAYSEIGNYWLSNSSGIKYWAFKTPQESFISLLKFHNIEIPQDSKLLILRK